MSNVKIKICGLRNEEDILAVNSAMPDYIGFVFAESKRQISPEIAAKLKDLLDKRIKAVGVFVNQPVDFISELYKNGIIEFAQLHGDEDNEYINTLRNSCGCKIIKSISISNDIPILPEAADYLLFDKASKLRGGTGETFDWDILSNYSGIPFFLAGGLSPDNVTDALSHLSPFAVDVSSGVETNNCKDANKIVEFIQKVRSMK